MSYGRFKRSRGFGRGFGIGWGRGFGISWSRGRGFSVGSGFGMNPLFYDGLSHERQRTGNTPYSNMFAG